MFTKTTGILIIPIWLGAMGWLVAHDVWPGLTADDAPPLQVTDWLQNEGRQSQFSLTGPDGRIGTLWTEYMIDRSSIQREDLIWIDHLPLDVAPLRVTVSSIFRADGVLDEFTLRIANPDGRMEVHGERFHADFSYYIEGTGFRRRTFKLPLTDASLVSGAFNPFSQLSNLEVGQRWRMQVFNPIAALTGFGNRFIPMLVEVTGSEPLATAKGRVDCMIVESANAKAWVDPQGSVRLQEITLPVIGSLRIAREATYDDDARNAARRRVLEP